MSIKFAEPLEIESRGRNDEIVVNPLFADEPAVESDVRERAGSRRKRLGWLFRRDVGSWCVFGICAVLILAIVIFLASGGADLPSKRSSDALDAGVSGSPSANASFSCVPSTNSSSLPLNSSSSPSASVSSSSVSSSSTPTASPTGTPSATASTSSSAGPTPSVTPSATASVTVGASASTTASSTPTPSETPTPSVTATTSNTPTPTPTGTATPSPSPNRLELVADVKPGHISGTPSYMDIFDNLLVFVAVGPDNRVNIYSYNGSIVAKFIQTHTSGTSSPAFLAVDNVNGNVWLKLFSDPAGQNLGQELYCWNATNGLQLAIDIRVGSQSSQPNHLAVANGTVFFSASVDVGRELYSFSWTQGLKLLADVQPGILGSDPIWLEPYDGYMFFEAQIVRDGPRTLVAWSNSSGAFEAATVPGARYLHAFDGVLYFASGGAASEIYSFTFQDGVKIIDVNPGSGGSEPAFFAGLGNKLYFTGDAGNGTGRDLLSYQITTGKISQEVDFPEAAPTLAYTTAFQNRIYFEYDAEDLNLGTELWRFNP